MSRHVRSLLRLTAAVAGAGLLVLGASTVADAVARTPSISGNSWVALLVIGVLVVTIYMLIAGALHVERRDARLGGGGRRRDDNGWFGIFPAGPADEEDAPDHLRHGGGDGGEGGEGGEGGWGS